MVPKRRVYRFCVSLLGLALCVASFGCGASNIMSRRTIGETQGLEKPARVLVFDVDSEHPSGPALASTLSNRMVRELQQRDIAGEWARGAPPAQPGDFIVHGEFIRVDPGNKALRALVGFHAGATKLQTQLNVYVMTEGGRMPIYQMELEAKGSYWPFFFALTDRGLRGDAQRTALHAAQLLTRFFRRQGWVR